MLQPVTDLSTAVVYIAGRLLKVRTLTTIKDNNKLTRSTLVTLERPSGLYGQAQTWEMIGAAARSVARDELDRAVVLLAYSTDGLLLWRSRQTQLLQLYG